MSAIEDYINNYKEKSGLKMHSVLSYVSTAQVASPADVRNIKEPTVINTSYWKNVFLFIPVFLFAGFYAYKSFSKSALNIIPFLFVLVIAIILIWQAWQKQVSPEIEVYADKEKLTIKTQTFEWANIINAYILSDNSSKNTFRFLLLETKNEGIVQISFNKLSVDRKRLAAVIEHYKK